MPEPQIHFPDGAAYARMMGSWSPLAGNVLLDWLAPPPGLRWIDVGCGNGAFTTLLVERCAPAEVQAIDPSEGQLAFARTQPAARVAALRELWTGAGIEGIETREIAVQPTFADFDDFWTTSQLASTIGSAIAGMAPADLERLEVRVRQRLPADEAGRITYGARANAIKGRMPA